MLSKMLSELRKKNKIDVKEISNNIDLSNQGVYYTERNLEKNSNFKYLLFLRSKKININALFDEFLKNMKDEK